MEVSNADRVVFSSVGITKGDVVDYYLRVADRMLPFMVGRALTVERYPKGLDGNGFMQKNAPEHFSGELIDRHEVPKEEGGTTVYPVLDSVEGIAAFANLGVITFHVPPSRSDDPTHPDWLIWDLDPPEGGFDRARSAAHELRAVLEDHGIPTLPMTSGSKGYHLRARVVPNIDADDAAAIARGTAALAVAGNQDLMTLAFRKKDRGDRVFVDWLRNAPYSTSVVPWSLRAREGAPIATPLTWDEVDTVDPDGVTLLNVEERLDTDRWGDPTSTDLSSRVETVEEALEDAGIDLEPFDRFRS